MGSREENEAGAPGEDTDRILLIPLWDEGNLEEMDHLIQPVIFQIRKLRSRSRLEFSASVCKLMPAVKISNSKISVDASHSTYFLLH